MSTESSITHQPPGFSDLLPSFRSRFEGVIGTLAEIQGILRNARAPLPLSKINDLLGHVQLGSADIEAEFLPHPEHYSRNVVFEDVRSSLVAITWLPGQSSPIHNHCDSACGVRVVEGIAAEAKFLPVGDGQAVRLGSDVLYQAGEIFGGEGSNDLHLVANRGQKILRTLHIYSPPLKPAMMQIFDEV